MGFPSRAYVGSCWENLRKARADISSCKEALRGIEMVEGAELVKKVRESLLQYQREQREVLVRHHHLIVFITLIHV